MKFGHWVPLSKELVKYLPKDRPYTELEAAYSLQLDYDANNPITVAGYSALWRWSRNKVNLFLQRLGIFLLPQVEEKHLKNQKRHISIHKKDISQGKKAHIRLIDNRELQNQKDISSEKNGNKKDIHGITTIDTRNQKKNSNLKNPCPYDQILDLYHAILSDLPCVRNFSERRRKMLLARWNEKTRSESGLLSNTLEFWEAFFKYINHSDFLMGRKSDWQANFEWIVTKRNFNKIIEGVYNHG